MTAYSVLFGDGRQVVFPPPSDPQHPASKYWRSVEAFSIYFEDCERFCDVEDRVVAILPAVTYSPWGG